MKKNKYKEGMLMKKKYTGGEVFQRKWVIQLIVVGLGIAALPNLTTAQPDVSNRPNIVFVLADDMGWGDLGCYGHPYTKTPHLDRLAKQGILFTSFYVTGPSCSPSRTGFMTGQFPDSLGVHSALFSPGVNDWLGSVDYLDPAIPTITKLLHDAGYTTGHFGKWHLGHTSDSPSPAAYGIDDVGCFNAMNHEALLPEQKLKVKGRGRSCETIVDEGIRFIEENQDKPFYVNLWFVDPHSILNPTEEQMKPYEKFNTKGVSDHGAMQVYFSVVSELDQQVGRLMKRLDELDLAENTIVVFSSDNGPEQICAPGGEAANSGVGSAGPFRGIKTSLYEGGTRVPFILRWSGRTPAGKVDDDTILGGADWLPTLCALSGIKLPSDMVLDGEDMSQAFLGKGQERTKPLMWESRFRDAYVPLHVSPQLAIRDGNWKLLINPDKSHLELYDMSNKLFEMNNLAASNPEVAAQLSKQVLDWHENQPPLPAPPPDVLKKIQNTPRPYPWPKAAGK